METTFPRKILDADAAAWAAEQHFALRPLRDGEAMGVEKMGHRWLLRRAIYIRFFLSVRSRREWR